jgi:antitoxin component YwqK of YwqJK toxin-antitoxin module
MKNWMYIFALIAVGFISCESEEKTEEPKTITNLDSEEDLIEQMPNMYREYFPGKKQIKITGPLDNEGKRHGTWESFFENGQKNSATYYVHGVREGHSIVYYPNGAIFYYGEYKNDEKVGLWKTFNENGELASEDSF